METSWKDEFYRVDSDDVEEKDALAHSLKKWQGLQKENLERHDCCIRDGDVIEKDAGDNDDYDYYPESLCIDYLSCALCGYYMKSADSNDADCLECPIFNLNPSCCHSSIPGEKDTPWDAWSVNEDPLPMIQLLEKAISVANKRRHKSQVTQS